MGLAVWCTHGGIPPRHMGKRSVEPSPRRGRGRVRVGSRSGVTSQSVYVVRRSGFCTLHFAIPFFHFVLAAKDPWSHRPGGRNRRDQCKLKIAKCKSQNPGHGVKTGSRWVCLQRLIRRQVVIDRSAVFQHGCDLPCARVALHEQEPRRPVIKLGRLFAPLVDLDDMVRGRKPPRAWVRRRTEPTASCGQRRPRRTDHTYHPGPQCTCTSRRTWDDSISARGILLPACSWCAPCESWQEMWYQ